jgi:Tfp pilus assembly protein PilW
MCASVETTRADNGAMLVEVILSLFVIVSVTGGIYSLFTQSQRISAGQTSFLGMHQNARNAIDLISRELMLAGCDFTNPDNIFLRIPPILEPSSTGIRILTDLNQDGDTGDENEDIQYCWDASTREITRDSGSGEVVISENVTSFSITYDHGASTLSHGAAADDTILLVESTAGFKIGDLVYVADGNNLDSTFIIDVLSNRLAIDPPIDNYYLAGSTVAYIETINVSLTAQTEEEDHQTHRYKSMSLSSDIKLRNEIF